MTFDQVRHQALHRLDVHAKSLEANEVNALLRRPNTAMKTPFSEIKNCSQLVRGQDRWAR